MCVSRLELLKPLPCLCSAVATHDLLFPNLLGLRPARRASRFRSHLHAHGTAGAAEECALWHVLTPAPAPVPSARFELLKKKAPEYLAGVPHEVYSDSIRSTPGRFQEVGLAAPRLHVDGAPPSVVTVSCCKCPGVDLPLAGEKNRGAVLMNVVILFFAPLFAFCGQMWNGLNSQNHGADGFLHHDRKEHQLQGNFGQ